MRTLETYPLTRLKAERLKRGWSQQTLGFHAGVAAPDVSKIENRRALPYPGQAKRLADILGLEPDELQEQEEESMKTLTFNTINRECFRQMVKSGFLRDGDGKDSDGRWESVKLTMRHQIGHSSALSSGRYKPLFELKEDNYEKEVVASIPVDMLVDLLASGALDFEYYLTGRYPDGSTTFVSDNQLSVFRSADFAGIQGVYKVQQSGFTGKVYSEDLVDVAEYFSGAESLQLVPKTWPELVDLVQDRQQWWSAVVVEDIGAAEMYSVQGGGADPTYSTVPNPYYGTKLKVPIVKILVPDSVVVEGMEKEWFVAVAEASYQEIITRLDKIEADVGYLVEQSKK